ncbi:MAG: imidazole glycerol phosphate synthase subunit HisH [Dehalococcoidia bacterium]|jgi:glutamine amidotransferase
MLVIIDYGAGNLRSVYKAVGKLGFDAKLTTNPDDVMAADAVILPGVGAGEDTMNALKKLGMVSAIKQYVDESRPFLGICIGMQVLFTGTEEGGWHECLDIVGGRVVKLPEGNKIPHMGWNQVKQKVNHPVFTGIPDNTNFYFVHSFYGKPDDESVIAAETEYGAVIPSVIIKGNLVATQFHPEKSGDPGLKFYDNFFKLVAGQYRPENKQATVEN